MTYKTEFDREEWPEQNEIDALEKLGALDQSWHNDVCPIWSLGEHSIAINSDKSVKRYCVFLEEEPDEILYHGDDFESALTRLIGE